MQALVTTIRIGCQDDSIRTHQNRTWDPDDLERGNRVILPAVERVQPRHRLFVGSEVGDILLIVTDGNTQNLESTVLVLVVGLFDVRKFSDTRRAPRRPEIDQVDRTRQSFARMEDG